MFKLDNTPVKNLTMSHEGTCCSDKESYRISSWGLHFVVRKSLRMSFIFTVTSFMPTPPLLPSTTYLFKGFSTFVFAVKGSKCWQEGKLCEHNCVSHWLIVLRNGLPKSKIKCLWCGKMCFLSVLSFCCAVSCDSTNFMLIFWGGCVHLPSASLIQTILFNKTELTVPCVYL